MYYVFITMYYSHLQHGFGFMVFLMILVLCYFLYENGPQTVTVYEPITSEPRLVPYDFYSRHDFVGLFVYLYTLIICLFVCYFIQGYQTLKAVWSHFRIVVKVNMRSHFKINYYLVIWSKRFVSPTFGKTATRIALCLFLFCFVMSCFVFCFVFFFVLFVFVLFCFLFLFLFFCFCLFLGNG